MFIAELLKLEHVETLKIFLTYMSPLQRDTEHPD